MILGAGFGLRAAALAMIRGLWNPVYFRAGLPSQSSRRTAAGSIIRCTRSASQRSVSRT
jgi:hypothetical protein